MDNSVRLDPAISDYPFAQEAIGTPSVRSTLTEDVYLTLASTPSKPGSAVVIGVIVEPLVSWIWLGGAVMAFGTLMSAWPRRRRDVKSKPDAENAQAGGTVTPEALLDRPEALVTVPIRATRLGTASGRQLHRSPASPRARFQTQRPQEPVLHVGGGPVRSFTRRWS